MNIVVTNLLTKERDPQRRRHMSSDPAMFAALRESTIAHGAHLVVINDCLKLHDDEHTSYVKVRGGGNPYFSRWSNIARWIETCSEVLDFVWCVDATDVVMLHDPFPHMKAGEFYTGSEPRPLGGTTEHHGWLYLNHPSRAEFYAAHPDQPFLNPGIIGGSAGDVHEACAQLGVETGEITDMGAWQQIAHDLFAERLVTGLPVHTEYRAMDYTNQVAWWAHKSFGQLFTLGVIAYGLLGRWL